ncbi:ODV-E25 [Perigonia lusca single nucleopolyhedrovirus]|uniref:ODV-E25 n=1 Tax=Perigonia lusca single nucleopolyhedrovirus TaxID=1675865 RepID=A0A0M3WP77_9ABAC|nr:ODV-E25 [Perigonia lusca single nucleopolyhedrovirus]AKN80586.1 ODV-E25 [Perigonia lusca single nucleopolyhedrovirus]
MIGVIVLILIVLVVLYFLSINNKLNFNSLNDSSPSLGQSSESVQINPTTGQYSVKLNSNPRIKSMRVLHGDNKISKVYVAERALTYNEVIDEGNRSLGTNCVFIGTLSDSVSVTNASAPASNTATATTSANRITPNFEIKQFKNMFIIFKNLEASKIKENINMVRYESEGMVYCLIDANTSTVPDLRDVSYPIVVYTTNTNVQLKLKEWDYAQINDSATTFIKNEKSFRLQ